MGNESAGLAPPRVRRPRPAPLCPSPQARILEGFSPSSGATRTKARGAAGAARVCGGAVRGGGGGASRADNAGRAKPGRAAPLGARPFSWAFAAPLSSSPPASCGRGMHGTSLGRRSALAPTAGAAEALRGRSAVGPRRALPSALRRGARSLYSWLLGHCVKRRRRRRWAGRPLRGGWRWKERPHASRVGALSSGQAAGHPGWLLGCGRGGGGWRGALASLERLPGATPHFVLFSRFICAHFHFLLPSAKREKQTKESHFFSRLVK